MPLCTPAPWTRAQHSTRGKDRATKYASPLLKWQREVSREENTRTKKDLPNYILNVSTRQHLFFPLHACQGRIIFLNVRATLRQPGKVHVREIFITGKAALVAVVVVGRG